MSLTGSHTAATPLIIGTSRVDWSNRLRPRDATRTTSRFEHRHASVHEPAIYASQASLASPGGELALACEGVPHKRHLTRDACTAPLAGVLALHAVRTL